MGNKMSPKIFKERIKGKMDGMKDKPYLDEEYYKNMGIPKNSTKPFYRLSKTNVFVDWYYKPDKLNNINHLENY